MSFQIMIIYMIICYGIANTIIYAHGPFHCFDKMHEIAYKIHPQIEEMLSCFICSGWWIGFFFSMLNIIFVPSIALTPMMMIHLPMKYWYATIFLDGAFVSSSNWLINTLQNYFETNSKNDE